MSVRTKANYRWYARRHARPVAKNINPSCELSLAILPALTRWNTSPVTRGTRKALIDIALKTADAGYLTTFS